MSEIPVCSTDWPTARRRTFFSEIDLPCFVLLSKMSCWKYSDCLWNLPRLWYKESPNFSWQRFIHIGCTQWKICRMRTAPWGISNYYLKRTKADNLPTGLLRCLLVNMLSSIEEVLTKCPVLYRCPASTQKCSKVLIWELNQSRIFLPIKIAETHWPPISSFSFLCWACSVWKAGIVRKLELKVIVTREL